MDARRLPLAIRVLRQHRGWRQDDLARASDVSQTTVSLLESGELEGVTLRTLDEVVKALDATLVLDIRWKGGTLDRLLDERHAVLSGIALEVLQSFGWQTEIEVTYAHFGERGSIDILAWHAATRSLLVVEVKTELTSIEETLRRHDQKVRLGAAVARERFGWSPAAVSRLLVLPDTSTSRRRVERHAAVLRTAMPARNIEVRRWLIDPVGKLAGIMFLSSTAVVGAMSGSVTRQRVRKRGARSGE